MSIRNLIFMSLFLPLFQCLNAHVCLAQVVFDRGQLDGGQLLQNQDRSFSMRLHNRYNREVVLGQVSVDCSCLQLGGLPKSIGAHETIEVRLTIKTGALNGPQKKSLQVRGKGKKVLCQVLVVFRVIPEFQLSPSHVNLGRLVPGQVVERKILIRGRVGASSSLSVAKQVVPEVETTLNVVDQESKDHLWLALVKISIPKKMKAGRFERRVPIVVTKGRVKQLVLHLYGDVETDVTIHPRIADFGKVIQRRESTLKLVLESRSRRRFRIKDVLEDGVAFADFDESLLAYRHEVTLQLPQGQTLGAKFGYFKFLTDHPDVSVIELSYRARVVKGKK